MISARRMGLLGGALALLLLMAVAARGDDPGEQALSPAGGDVPSPAAACLEGAEDCSDTLFPGDEPRVGLPSTGGADDLLTSEPLTISQALEAAGTVAVRGFYVHGGDGPRLCEALAESLPPLCSGASVSLADTSTIDPESVKTAQSTSWTDFPVIVVGEIVDGVLVPIPMSA